MKPGSSFCDPLELIRFVHGSTWGSGPDEDGFPPHPFPSLIMFVYFEQF